MPDPSAAASLPADGLRALPMGICEDGKPPAELDSSKLKLRSTDVFGSIPKDLVTAKANSKKPTYGMEGGEIAANKLSEAGWAIMFGATVDPKIKASLTDLIDYRKKQVGDPNLFKELNPPQTGQSANDWATDLKISLANIVDPVKGVPYYVLIVASPEDVSFEFQYELDLNWGVGRLWLETPEAFERYAHSVIAYEKRLRNDDPAPRKLVIFAPDYNGKDDDGRGSAGKYMLNYLATPLANKLGQTKGLELQTFFGAQATRQNLDNIFTGEIEGSAPAFLFTGTHGILKRKESSELAQAQGALVCQEYQGQPPMPDVYYAGWDFPKKPKVHGLVHMLFACYGLGWPAYDTYNYRQKVSISPAPMLANLPQKLLSAEDGALAVLGHIDQAWSSSYQSDGEPLEQTYADVVKKVLSGYRLGNATDEFNSKWAKLSVPLEATRVRMATKRGLEDTLAHQLLMRDDARNYILHGDPAVQLYRVD